MSILRRLVGGQEQRAASLGDLLLRLRGGPTFAGVSVNDVTALANDAVWACVTLLCDVISTLPLDAVKRSGGIRVPVEPSPPVIDRPSAWLTRPEWLHQIVWSMATRGNAFGVVTARDATLLRPTQVEILDPACVQVYRSGRTGPPSYRLHGESRDLPYGDVLHIPAPAPPGGISGMSYVEQAAQAIGFALAAERYGARYFGDGVHPSAVLSTDAKVTEDDARVIKERFRNAISGREPAVLGRNMKYEAIQGDPERAQLTPTSILLVERIARFWRIDPEMIGASRSGGGSITYANREQRAIDLVTFTFAPWLTRIEARLSDLLARGTVAKFNIGALLRADTLTRYQAHDTAIRGGWRSVNESRELEDEEPIGTDGDQYLWPPYATILTSTGGTNVPAAP